MLNKSRHGGVLGEVLGDGSHMIARYRAAVTADFHSAAEIAPPRTFPEQHIDFEAATKFLALLNAERATFQTFGEGQKDDDKSLARILDGTLDEHADALSGLNKLGAGIFVSVNQTDGRGRKRDNITSVRAVTLDLDGEPLDPVRQCPLKPHIIVESSPGRFHAYWRVESLSLDQYEGIQRAIAQRFDGDPAVALLTACARLPGYFHNKGQPFQTHIVETNEQPPYTADQILDEFPPLAKPHAPPISRTGVLPPGAPVKWAEEFLKQCRSVNDMTLLRHYRGAFYEYTGTHYRELADKYVESEVYAFLNKVYVLEKKGLAPFNPTRGKVAEVVHALRRGTGTLIPQRREAPCWLDNRDTPAENLVSCRNGISQSRHPAVDGARSEILHDELVAARV